MLSARQDHFTNSLRRNLGGLLFLLPGPVLALEWERVELPFESARVHVIADAPSQPLRLYSAAHLGGIYRSDDRGDHWVFANEGIPRDKDVRSLLVDPQDPDLVIAGVGGDVYRTDDGGANWVLWEENAPTAYVRPLAFSPAQAGLVLGTISNGNGPVGRSTDYGKTWVASSNGIANGIIYEFSFNPASPNEVVAAAANGTLEGVFWSSDSGLNWALHSPSEFCRSVSWSPVDPDLVFAYLSIGGGAKVYRSTDGGLSFQFAGNVPIPDTFVICAHPTDAQVVFAAGDTFYGFEDYYQRPVVSRSTNQGTSWSLSFEGPWILGSYTYAENILIDPLAPQFVTITGGAGTGIYRSDNHGASDYNLKVDGMQSAQITAIDDDSDETIVARDPTMKPFLYSTQTSETQILPSVASSIVSVNRVELLDGDIIRIFECGGMGYDGYTISGYLRWMDGQVWNPPNSFLPSGFEYEDRIRCVAISGNASNRVYAWCETDAAGESVYRSDDGGNSYEPVGPFPSFIDGIVDPSNDLRLFAMSESGDPVRMSTNGGVSWESRSGGLPTGPRLALRRDVQNPDHLLAVFTLDDAYVTTNAGLSWSGVPLDLEGAIPISADWDPQFDRVILATNNHGVYVSGIGYFNSGIPSHLLETVHYFAAEQQVYLGTRHVGLWKASLPSVAVGAHEPAASNLVSAEIRTAPNPFRDKTRIHFSMPGNELVRVEIFDAAGRRVRTLSSGESPTTSGALEWNGRNEQGNLVAAGIYTIVIRSSSHRVSSSITCIR
jgi:hypothetical protein